MTDLPEFTPADMQAELARPVPDASIDSADETQPPAHDSEATHNVMAPPPETETGVNLPLGRVATGGDEPDEPNPTHNEAEREHAEPEGADAGDTPPPPAPPPDQTAMESGDGPRDRAHYDTAGRLIGLETVDTLEGRPRVHFRPSDSEGTRLTWPSSPSGITLEGPSSAEDMLHHTVERDEAGRPTVVLGISATPDASTTLPDNMAPSMSPAEWDRLVPQLYRETRLSYTPTGLLETVVTTDRQANDIRQTIYHNSFDDTGRYTGYVREELAGGMPGTETAVYDTTLVTIFDRQDDRWREITYVGFRDGLRPASVREGRGQLFQAESKLYLAPAIDPEQRPYSIASYVSGTPLTEQLPGLLIDGEETVTLPSWIPKTAAEDIASHRMSLSEASEAPDFPEIHIDTTILDRSTVADALTSGMIPTTTAAETADFINGLRTREWVVLNTGEFPDELALRLSMPDVQEQRSEHQKAALVASLHPAFSRQDAVPDAWTRRQRDQTTFITLLAFLGVDRQELATAVDALPGLSEDARECFDYLLAR